MFRCCDVGACVFAIITVSLSLRNECPSMFLVTVFALKSVLSDIRRANATLFWLPLDESLFPSLHFDGMYIIKAEMNLSKAACN